MIYYSYNCINARLKTQYGQTNMDVGDISWDHSTIVNDRPRHIP